VSVESRKRGRGRPPKFGRRGQVVAVTLPDEVVDGLRQLDDDLGWAIVRVYEQSSDRPRTRRTPPADAELVSVGGRRSLITVNQKCLTNLPGVNIIPLHDDRAFLALEPGRGMADLELAVIDRLASASLDAREKKALTRLRTELRRWRSDRSLRGYTRAIIVIEHVK